PSAAPSWKNNLAEHLQPWLVVHQDAVENNLAQPKHQRCHGPQKSAYHQINRPVFSLHVRVILAIAEKTQIVQSNRSEFPFYTSLVLQQVRQLPSVLMALAIHSMLFYGDVGVGF